MTSPAAFVELVTGLTEVLSTDITVDQIAMRVGKWAAHPEALVPTELQSVSGLVDRASLTRFPDSDLAYALTLVPDEAAAPPVSALRAAWGDPRVSHAGPDQPTELQFRPTTVDGPWSVVVVAWARRRGSDLDEAVVTQVLLRRGRRA